MTHLQLEEQTPKDISRPPSTPTSHYDQRMVKAGDYRQASGQSGIGGRGSTWRSLFGWHRHRRGAVRSRRCLMRLCWKPVSRRLSLTWSFCSRDIHLPPIWRAGGEGCFIICFASLDVFRHQAKGNNQAYVVFESNKHNISCYCILMWFFIDPCRKTLVFLALQTRARRLEVSCLLGLWFVNLSARGGSSSSSCSQTSVLSRFSCSSCFHSFTRRQQQQEESVFTHMQITDAKRSLHI